MEYLKVLAAAIGAFAFAGIWYSTLSKQWIAAAGIEVDKDGKPVGGSTVTPMVVAGVAMILVAGMMRHIFQGSGITTFGAGILGGLGVGAFIITPWMAMNYAFSMRPRNLAIIDGVNAIVGCGIMGLILTLW